VSYNHRRTITTDHTQVSGTENFVDFPLLVTLSGSYLCPTISGGKIEHPYGYDIIFTTISGEQLDHQVNAYLPQEHKMTAWVCLPTLSPNYDIDFYVYYGNSGITSPTENPTGVWNSSYKAVLHLEEFGGTTATGTVDVWLDSTQNGNHMHDWVSAQGKEGIVHHGQEFDGVDDRMEAHSTPSLEISDAITMSAWVKVDTWPSGNDKWYNIMVKGPEQNEGYAMFLYSDSGTSMVLAADFGFSTGDVDYFDVCDIPILLNVWTYCVVTFDGTDFKFYVNGVLDATVTNSGTITTSESDFHLGNTDALGGEYFDGHIDEARVQSRALTEPWIQTEYNNQYHHLPPPGDETHDTGEEYTYINGEYKPNSEISRHKFIGIQDGAKWVGVPFASVNNIIKIPWESIEQSL